MLVVLRTAPRRAGFTLIELLAVLMILAILIALLVTNLAAPKQQVEEGVARNRMAQISAALNQYVDDTGSPPASQLPSEFGSGNADNVGAECLYLALCAQGAPGYGVLDKDETLCNTDHDSLSKRPKGFETQELFEIADPWGNPYAYIQFGDYDREFHYVTIDDNGVEQDGMVRAQKNEKTGRYEEPHGFQIFSAGADGKFGTEDDLPSFKKH